MKRQLTPSLHYWELVNITSSLICSIAFDFKRFLLIIMFFHVSEFGYKIIQYKNSSRPFKNFSETKIYQKKMSKKILAPIQIEKGL